MVRVDFDPDSIDWNDYFNLQVGGGLYFEGLPYQRGYGIGAVLGSLFRFLVPIAKTLGIELGRESLQTGTRILDDVSTGESLKSSVRKETRQGLKNLIDNVYDKTQTGSGRKKGIKGKKPTAIKLYCKVGPKKRSDYFGSFE